MPVKHRKPSLQQLNFVECLFRPEVGFNHALAYRMAYPKCKRNSNSLAAKLVAKGTIKEYIAKKKAEIAAKIGYGKVEAMKEADAALTLAMSERQPAAAGSIIGLKAKLNGLIVDKGQVDHKHSFHRPPAREAIETSESKRKAIECKEIDNE